MKKTTAPQVPLSLKEAFAKAPALIKALLAVAIVATLLRFFGLETSPPGFFVDEAAISAQVMCVRQSGHDVYGQRYPLLSPVLAGGFVTPTYLYSGVVWSSIFGDSIGAYRAMTAFYGALAVVGTFFFAWALFSSFNVAVFAGLATAISPWAFTMARIAWDPALAPAFLVWALYFLFRNGKRLWLDGILSGTMFALASYAYPTLRPQIMLIFPAFAAIIFWLRPAARRVIPISFVTMVVFSIPLIKLTLTGEIQGRFQMLSIFGDYYMQQFGGFSWWIAIKTFFENVRLHLTPTYLFWSGDANLRHATGSSGQWSWLEILGVVLAIVFLFRKKLVTKPLEKWALIALILGYVAGFLPACLTWEYNPHALRSIGSYPFIGVFAGYALAVASEQWKAVRALALVVAVAFFGYYFQDLYFKYPQRTAHWFDQNIVDMADSFRKQGKPGEFKAAAKEASKDYPDLGIFYYELRDGAARCN